MHPDVAFSKREFVGEIYDHRQVKADWVYFVYAYWSICKWYIYVNNKYINYSWDGLLLTRRWQLISQQTLFTLDGWLETLCNTTDGENYLSRLKEYFVRKRLENSKCHRIRYCWSSLHLVVVKNVDEHMHKWSVSSAI